MFTFISEGVQQKEKGDDRTSFGLPLSFGFTFTCAMVIIRNCLLLEVANLFNILGDCGNQRALTMAHFAKRSKQERTI